MPFLNYKKSKRYIAVQNKLILYDYRCNYLILKDSLWSLKFWLSSIGCAVQEKTGFGQG